MKILDPPLTMPAIHSKSGTLYNAIFHYTFSVSDVAYSTHFFHYVETTRKTSQCIMKILLMYFGGPSSAIFSRKDKCCAWLQDMLWKHNLRRLRKISHFQDFLGKIFPRQTAKMPPSSKEWEHACSPFLYQVGRGGGGDSRLIFIINCVITEYFHSSPYFYSWPQPYFIHIFWDV